MAQVQLDADEGFRKCLKVCFELCLKQRLAVRGFGTAMIEGIFLSLLAATTYGLLGVSYELAAKRRYKILDVVSYMQLTGLVIGSVITAFFGLPFFNTRLLALGFLGAATFVGSIACYLMASRERDIGANWTIVNLSVILPILVSILWFHDTFTALKALAIVFTVLSIVIIGGGFKGAKGGEHGSRWVKYIVLAFFLECMAAYLIEVCPARLLCLVHDVPIRHRLSASPRL